MIGETDLLRELIAALSTERQYIYLALQDYDATHGAITADLDRAVIVRDLDAVDELLKRAAIRIEAKP